MAKRILLLSLPVIAMICIEGCGAKEGLQRIHFPALTGPLTHLILLAAIIIVGILVNQKGEANEDSLFKLGNRLRNLEDKLEEIEKKVDASSGGAKKEVKGAKKEEKPE